MKTILIVDDSIFDRNLIATALRKMGHYNIIEAENGEECISMLSKHTVNLVLLDIIMPNINGIDVLHKIRQTLGLMELPIIMVTGKTENSDIIHFLDNGASDYITKPINFGVAISRIELHLKFVDLSIELSNAKSAASLSALISTYNHEINNPLTIAIGYLSKKDWATEENHTKINEALWRISEIVKKIKEVSDKKEVELKLYGQKNKMIKLE